MIDADGGVARQLTKHAGRDVAPAWSPDGSKIAFMSDRGGKGFEVFVMNADGSGVEQFTTTGSSWFPQFSPDGTRIALHVHRDVHILDLATKTLASVDDRSDERDVSRPGRQTAGSRS